MIVRVHAANICIIITYFYKKSKTNMLVSFTIIRVIITNIRVIVVYIRNRIMKFRVTATNIRLHS